MNPRLLLALAVLSATPAFAQVANIKVVTDANPDYSDMESMVRSITSNWKTDAEKMYALFYWDHIARRQTAPMMLHGLELTDPIRQYNDYGFTMCSTISGIKNSEWQYMGYPSRFFDIAVHTVPDVWYDGGFHHYDNSLSVYYTKCDGKTVAAIDEVGKTLGCAASGGKEEPGHIAIYHAVNSTSVNGYLEGADTERNLEHLGQDTYKPAYLKYRNYLYGHDRGHRYILNLRDGENYARFYTRQDIKSAGAVVLDKNVPDYKADPAYFVPNGKTNAGNPMDPELPNPRYTIRGNGERTWTPLLDEAHLAGSLHSSSNIKATASGLAAVDASKPAEAIFKVEGANVITSLKVRAEGNGPYKTAISTTNGLQWISVGDPSVAAAGTAPGELKLIEQVNGSYEVLVKFTLEPSTSLKNIAFNAITEVNAKTQPQLKLGKNTVYVGHGEQTESIVLWPELQADRYKPFAHETKNVKTDKEHGGYYGVLKQDKEGEEGYVVFKINAPRDLTAVTYGGRFYNRAPKAHIDLLHSFDGGQTWKQSYSLTDTNPPWDTIHYERITDIPAGTKSVLLKYAMNGGSIYAVHMEANHKLAAQAQQPPLEVTFSWQERQKDYTTVKRSHTQRVEKFPLAYTINVGGFDHPIVDSLTIRNANVPSASPIKTGYSDGKDVGGEKFVGKSITYGKNLALKKPYTCTVPSDTQWEAGDPDLKKLTDGVVGSSYNGGINYRQGGIWKPNDNPEITVDLGAPQKCAAFRIHTLGYEGLEAIKGLNNDKIEVLTSLDGKEFKSIGSFDFRLYWKDIPVNFMWNDEETFKAHNFMMPVKDPVEARYVRYKVTDNKRYLGITEIQVLDSFEFKPFDLQIALPDPAQNGKAPPKPDVSPNARQWTEDQLPKNIIGIRRTFE